MMDRSPGQLRRELADVANLLSVVERDNQAAHERGDEAEAQSLRLWWFDLLRQDFRARLGLIFAGPTATPTND